MDELGVKSVSITGITALFTGMVLALQTAYSLEAFGGKMFIGRVVSLSLVRELGPVLTALMVGGRVGSGITAEIGSMTVTEQVDALRVHGDLADPPAGRAPGPRDRDHDAGPDGHRRSPRHPGRPRDRRRSSSR